MSLSQTLRFILGHPLNSRARLGALKRYVSWQLGSRMVPGPVIVDFVNGSKLVMSPGRTGATANLYVGLAEVDDMAFVAHMLRPGDLFVDVGANIGAYTVLAAAVGARCLALEPSPQTFARLSENLRLNDLTATVTARQLAVGAASGELRFTAGLDTVEHVIARGESASATQVVAVQPLDDILANDEPYVMKIDVEGFETEVIRGANRTLSRPSLSAIVIEMNGSGARYGYDEAALHRDLVAHGFTNVTYSSGSRTLSAAHSPASDGNRIYVRDLQLARVRVAESPRLDITGHPSL